MLNTHAASLDELVSDPAKVQDLPGPVVRQLLVEVTSLLPLLVAHTQGGSTPEQAQHDDRLLTVDQAAAKLGLTRDWLYRRADELPFVVRVGRRLRFSERGAERWIKMRQGRAAG